MEVDGGSSLMVVLAMLWERRIVKSADVDSCGFRGEERRND